MTSFKQKKVARKAAAAKKANAPKANEPHKPAADVVKLPDRDGLVWLVSKKKLSPDEQLGCEHYRSAYRHPEAGAIRSHLDQTRGDGGGSPFHLDTVGPSLDAKRRLFSYRYTALAGDQQSILLMDAVCGGGLTIPAYLATNDSRKILEAQTILRMAGRMIAAMNWLNVEVEPGMRATA